MPPLTGKILQKINKSIQFEDTRLMSLDGAFWMSATVSLAKKAYLPKFTLSKLHISDRGSAFLDKTILFFGPDEARWEKNWMHLYENGKLRFIYSYDPLIVIEPDLEIGTCRELFRHNSALDFSRFRGSAASIKFGEGYLMVIHELMKSVSLSKDVFEKHYTHRFLFLDKNYKITKLSLPFKFEGSSVEYCTSMTLDHSEKNLVLAVGVYDSKAKLFLFDLDYVESLLEEISQSS